METKGEPMVGMEKTNNKIDVHGNFVYKGDEGC